MFVFRRSGACGGGTRVQVGHLRFGEALSTVSVAIDTRLCRVLPILQACWFVLVVVGSRGLWFCPGSFGLVSGAVGEPKKLMSR